MHELAIVTLSSIMTQNLNTWRQKGVMKESYTCRVSVKDVNREMVTDVLIEQAYSDASGSLQTICSCSNRRTDQLTADSSTGVSTTNALPELISPRLYRGLLNCCHLSVYRMLERILVTRAAEIQWCIYRHTQYTIFIAHRWRARCPEPWTPAAQLTASIYVLSNCMYLRPSCLRLHKLIRLYC